VGPFRTTPRGYRYILVVVDKFTKWIKVRAVASITSKEAAKFIEDITHRFGVPNRIFTDLGSAFTGSDFWDFCQDNLIDVYYALVVHPCYNGQVERANDMVRHHGWLAELPHVIWGLRT
jgi:transposase InsO family protein